MAAGFKVKRIASVSQSIGDKLKHSRTRAKITIADAEEETRIRAKFLTALEADSWDRIPSEVYGRGYLERYAEFLKLPVQELMAQYDRERSLYARRCQDSQIEFAPRANLQSPRLVVTARSIMVGVSALIVIAFVGFVGYQLDRFTKAPYLQLAPSVEAKELDSQIVVNGLLYTIKGVTVSDAVITVNGQLVNVAADGSFTQSVHLEPGVNSVVVEATNSNGKKTSEILSVLSR